MDRADMYCGRCRHWRFMKENEAEYNDKKFLPPEGITREDCAETCVKGTPSVPSIVMKYCYLGKCDIGAVDHIAGGKSIFCDECYAEDCCNQFEMFE